jgi:3',5'-cyclic AMP phosphodiesterase CpdA
VVVVSDTHLARRAVEAEGNWTAAVDHVQRVKPDLVLHVGDLSLDGAHYADDLVYARAQLERLAPTPWVAVPGNHDIGDNPVRGGDGGDAVSEERLGRWTRWVGPQWWEADVGGWRLVGVNAQLFGSGLSAEDDQWAWLEGVLGESAQERPVAFVCHKPVQASPEELATAPAVRFVPSPARDRLRSLLEDIPLVVSGHVHQYRSLQIGDTSHLWAPTTWALLPESWQPTVGEKRCGLVHLELCDGGVAHHHLVEPDGLQQFVVGRDTPLYYPDPDSSSRSTRRSSFPVGE